MKSITPATKDHVELVRLAGCHLRQARTFASLAGCPQLTNKIRRAIKSWDGARRHVRHRASRT